MPSFVKRGMMRTILDEINCGGLRITYGYAYLIRGRKDMLDTEPGAG
jgi:hypothetical protein